MIWVETHTVDYPTATVSGRFGGSVMFVAFDKWRKQWMWVQPGGVEERIAEPTHLLVDEAWAAAHKLAAPRARVENKRGHIRRKKQPTQMVLGL